MSEEKKERYKGSLRTEEQEKDKKVLLLSSLLSKLEPPKRCLLLSSPKSQHRVVVVRRLAAAAVVVVGWVVFACLSLHYNLQQPLGNMISSRKEEDANNNYNIKQQQPSLLRTNQNHQTTIIHVSTPLAEKKRMLQRKVRHWLLLASSSSSSLAMGSNAAALQQQQQQQQPPNTPGAFIHVSKTGGSTLSLQLRNACHSWMPKPCQHFFNNSNITNNNEEAIISRLSTYYHVPDFPLLAQRMQTAKKQKKDNNNNDKNTHAHAHAHAQHEYEFYVWTIRDPLERTISSFIYQHPENIKVRKAKYWKRLWQRGVPSFSCFPTLESFATALGGDGKNPLDDYYDNDNDYYPFNATTVNNTNCTRLARAIMDNKVAIPAHLYYSFNWLRKQHILPSPNTTTANNNNNAIHFAIRTEHLWDDWTTANQWLGQEHVTTFSNIRLRQQQHNHDDDDEDDPESNINYPVKREISAPGQERLCRALKNEYQAYLQILQQAVNLSDEERQDSLDQARQNCPSLNLQFHTTT